MKTDIKKHENGGAKSWIKAHLSDIIPVLGLILVLVFFLSLIHISEPTRH